MAKRKATLQDKKQIPPGWKPRPTDETDLVILWSQKKEPKAPPAKAAAKSSTSKAAGAKPSGKKR